MKSRLFLARIIRLAFLRQALSMSRDEAFRVMGIDPTASRDDIKHAYRKLMMQYHPDRSNDPSEVEQFTEKMRQINLAREVLEASPQNPHRPLEDSRSYTNVRDEEFWEKFHKRWGPKPAQRFTEQDIRNFIDQVFEKNYLQLVVRAEIPYWPLDMGLTSKGHYYRPVGPKVKTKRQKPEDKEAMLALFLKQPGTIFDVAVTPREAWVTWELRPGRDYRSAGFEPVKAPVKKDPNAGMTFAQVQSFLIEKGLAVVAGGSKYTYISVKGSGKRDAPAYIRLGMKNMVLVHRASTDDFKLSKETYYGQVTETILIGYISLLRKRFA